MTSEDDDGGSKFLTATGLLGWFFAIREHVTSFPAMDPSREVIQGLRVDKDVRLDWCARGEWLIRELQRREGGGFGAMLLWLHLRPRVVVGTKMKKGIKIQTWEAGVALWDLYQHPAVKAYAYGGQRKVVARYWDALNLVESLAVARGWLPKRGEHE